MFEFDRFGLRSRVASCLTEGSRVVAKGSFTKGYKQVNGFLVLNDFETLYLLEKSTIALETIDKIPISLQQAYDLKWSLMYSCFRELKRLGFSVLVNESQLHAFKRNLKKVQIVHARDLIQIHQDTLRKIGIVDGADISFISLDKVQDPL